MRFVQAGVMVLGAVLYFVAFGLNEVVNTPDYLGVVLWVAIGWNTLLLVVTVLVIIDSVRKVRAGRTRELATGVFVVKLAAIPFFVINFAVLAFIALFGVATIAFAIGLLALPVVAVGAILTYLAMLSTSVYGWAAIAQLRRERRIDRVLVVVYAVPLGVFVVDIVVGILLFVEYRRGVKSAPSLAPALAPIVQT